MKKLISVLLAVALMATLLVAGAYAAGYPERPVTAVVGWSVGGG